MMNEFLMCEHRNHTPPVEASRFYVLYTDYLSSEVWREYPLDFVWRSCEKCWNAEMFDYSDRQITKEDYLAALAMAEL